MQQPRNHRLYRTIIRLYPKTHRREYGAQMVQTLDDMLADHHGASGQLGVWLRVVFELPHNLVQEHVSNIRGMNMSGFKPTSKKIIVGVSVFGIALVAGVLVLVFGRQADYTPTTLSKVQHSTTPPACLVENPHLSVPSADQTFIANTVTTSIIDVPAGTKVDVELQSYSASTARGTAVYSDKYGRYNFTAAKVADNSTNNYVGGWKITGFEACKG